MRPLFPGEKNNMDGGGRPPTYVDFTHTISALKQRSGSQHNNIICIVFLSVMFTYFWVNSSCPDGEIANIAGKMSCFDQTSFSGAKVNSNTFSSDRNPMVSTRNQNARMLHTPPTLKKLDSPESMPRRKNNYPPRR